MSLPASSTSRRLRGLVQLADPKIWVASTVPMFVAAALAYSDTGRFAPGWFLLTLAGIYAVEVGKNAANEVVDWRSGADRFVAPEDATPFSGGKKTITGGLLSERDAIWIAVGSFAAAAVAGLPIALFRTWHAFWIAALGGFLALGYSVPPFSFCYRGLGELVVGITFGPLLMLGTYVVQTQQLSARPLVVGVPLGILIATVLWINEFPDFEADRRANKRNLVVRMGKARARVVYAWLLGLAEAAVIGVALYFRSPWMLLGLVGTGEASRAARVCWVAYDSTGELVPANAGTVKTYILTGVGLIAGALLQHWLPL
ncbi:MAG: 1,4-dihydroxy-2-naphthoate polyprenyltransferase [Bacillota bacterium]|nr:1,4-dihydroxy-2-naphthoate polyprenyltransferase [Bacillota bacterium]